MKNKTVETVNVPMYVFKLLNATPRTLPLLGTYIRVLHAIHHPNSNPQKIYLVDLFDWDEVETPRTMLLNDLCCLQDLGVILFTLHRDKEKGGQFIDVAYLEGWKKPAKSEENK